LSRLLRLNPLLVDHARKKTSTSALQRRAEKKQTVRKKKLEGPALQIGEKKKKKKKKKNHSENDSF